MFHRRYLGSRVRKTLENRIVEYRQANLTNPATVATVFEPPEGQPPWDYVFDFTGEIRFDRSDEVYSGLLPCPYPLMHHNADPFCPDHSIS
jgi:hypothetical protein